jgi:hypothetical protein
MERDWCQGIERSTCWVLRRDDEPFCIIASLAARLLTLEVGPAEVQEALATVSQALGPLKARKTVTWITDRGFDDVAVWRTIWDQKEHVVCRIYHTERTVMLQDQQGNWIQGTLAQAQEQVRRLARVETTLEVQRGKQRHPKRQPVEVEIASCPVRLTYSTGVRRKEPGELVTKDLWLVQVQVLLTTQAPWWLLTDWSVEDAQSALRIFIMYRERWAAEDSFKVTKECLGWEEVQVLDWQALQTLVALAWVTAGFLYQMGVTFQWAEVQLLAKLGGWEPHKDRKPGKITLMRGLSRLVEMLATQAVLSRYASEHQGLPPNITAFLQGWSPPVSYEWMSDLTLFSHEPSLKYLPTAFGGQLCPSRSWGSPR